MQVKSILFGFGLGLVFLSAIFLISFRWENRHADELYEDRILEQASQLGMVWPTDDVSEIVRRALEMGMLFENEEDQVEEDQDDEDQDDEDQAEEIE